MASKINLDRPESGFKDTIESIVITFLIAFMFRAYVVEAFEIPTGSMAPTLYGKHMDLTCDQCGYRFATEVPGVGVYTKKKSGKFTAEAACPMCKHILVMKAGSYVGIDGSVSLTLPPASAGDRIVVQKYLYSIQEPKRWDVVVFKNPVDPSVNFIKRLVGLPNEATWVIDGNIYTRKTGDQNGRWTIARKTDRPEAQNAVWQPIYHSAYVPLDNGTEGDDRTSNHRWQCPWQAQGGSWNLEGRDGYTLKPDAAGVLTGSLEFAAPAPKYPYSSQYDSGNSWRHAIEDIRLAATVVIDADAKDVQVVLGTTARLDDTTTAEAMAKDATLSNTHPIRARFAMNGDVMIERPDGDKVVALAQGTVSAMTPGGVGRRIELWYVDDEVSAWVDGKRVALHQFAAGGNGGWTAEQLIARAPIQPQPKVTIDVRGAAGTGNVGGVKLVNVDLDRDLYYGSGNSGGARGAQGTLVRREGGAEGQPIELEADQFFCLGDNSPWSLDGRLWPSVDPWIEARMLSSNLQRVGVVPRRLMMGRAFFVYFPAPHRANLLGNEWMIVPNFAEMRMIH